jgi:hypothetical protein
VAVELWGRTARVPFTEDVRGAAPAVPTASATPEALHVWGQAQRLRPALSPAVRPFNRPTLVARPVDVSGARLHRPAHHPLNRALSPRPRQPARP